MNDKILVLGKGFIGERLKEFFNCRIHESYIAGYSDAEKIIKRFSPRVIINCIGLTGRRNVDDCELEKDATLLANSFIPVMLAEACLRNNARLVHISSGCIFHFNYHKDKPITEEKAPDYFDLFYSRSKIYSELCLNHLARRYPVLIARIRIPLDNRPTRKNVLSKIIKYRKVIDLPNSVTYIPDFLRALKHLIDKKATGLYNLVNKGALRYPELLDVYRKYVPEFKYKVISMKKLKMNRTNLLLSTRKLEKSGFKVRDINLLLDECVSGYLKS
jgi:3,5-epimerase/4-reductase